MKRNLPLFFLTSFLFTVSPAAAQDTGSGGAAPVGDAATPPPLADAGPRGVADAAPEAGEGSGGGAGIPSLPEPREYDLLENDTKACTIGGVAPVSSGTGLLVAAAALGVAAGLRRSRRH